MTTRMTMGARARVTRQTPTGTRNDFNEPETSETVVYDSDLPCRLASSSTSVHIGDGRFVHSTRYVLFAPATSDVKVEDRVEMTSGRFNRYASQGTKLRVVGIVHRRHHIEATMEGLE